MYKKIKHPKGTNIFLTRIKNVSGMRSLQKFKRTFPVGKIAEKAVCKSVFLTIWHCNVSAELTKNALIHTVFLVFLPTGLELARAVL